MLLKYVKSDKSILIQETVFKEAKRRNRLKFFLSIFAETAVGHRHAWKCAKQMSRNRTGAMFNGGSSNGVWSTSNTTAVTTPTSTTALNTKRNSEAVISVVLTDEGLAKSGSKSRSNRSKVPISYWMDQIIIRIYWRHMFLFATCICKQEARMWLQNDFETHATHSRLEKIFGLNLKPTGSSQSCNILFGCRGIVEMFAYKLAIIGQAFKEASCYLKRYTFMPLFRPFR